MNTCQKCGLGSQKTICKYCKIATTIESSKNLRAKQRELDMRYYSKISNIRKRREDLLKTIDPQKLIDLVEHQREV